MKILTKEEENAHYGAVVKGGTVGGILGLAGGWAGLMLASRRWAGVRNLTLPMKAFLVTSSGTFAGIIAADQSSRSFDVGHYEQKSFFTERQARLRQEETAKMATMDRLKDFARREKYKIVGVTWLASIVGSFVLVGRNPYLTGQQKIVQARVYAQGLTLAVLCATAAFEIHDQRQGQGLLNTVKAKQKQTQKAAAKEEDLWKDMVAAEEERLKEKDEKKKA